jgi:hypothetical protein
LARQANSTASRSAATGAFRRVEGGSGTECR